jgi:hypothetical protein
VRSPEDARCTALVALSGSLRWLIRFNGLVSQACQSNDGERVRKRTLKLLVSGLVFLNDRRGNATALAHLLATLAGPLPNL